MEVVILVVTLDLLVNSTNVFVEESTLNLLIDFNFTLTSFNYRMCLPETCPEFNFRINRCCDPLLQNIDTGSRCCGNADIGEEKKCTFDTDCRQWYVS